MADSSPAIPRPAATVILLRSGPKHSSTGLEVLLAQRNRESKFMPGVWVFPGGGVDEADGADPGVPAAEVPEGAYRRCAARELAEEVNVSIGDLETLVLFSRWITPEMVPIRFDTVFYLGLAPGHVRPEPDGGETTAVRWVSPRTALDEHNAGEFPLVFPTIKHLEALTGFETPASLIEHTKARAVEPILPKLIEIDGEQRVVLPGEPGYPG